MTVASGPPSHECTRPSELGDCTCLVRPRLPGNVRFEVTDPRHGLTVGRGPFGHYDESRIQVNAVVEAKQIGIGIAVGAISDVSEFDAIYACADEAMYAAKRRGGNRIALGGATDAATSGRRQDEIHFRPMQLDDKLATDPLLSADGP